MEGSDVLNLIHGLSTKFLQAASPPLRHFPFYPIFFHMWWEFFWNFCHRQNRAIIYHDGLRICGGTFQYWQSLYRSRRSGACDWFATHLNNVRLSGRSSLHFCPRSKSRRFEHDLWYIIRAATSTLRSGQRKSRCNAEARLELRNGKNSRSSTVYREKRPHLKMRRAPTVINRNAINPPEEPSKASPTPAAPKGSKGNKTPSISKRSRIASLWATSNFSPKYEFIPDPLI